MKPRRKDSGFALLLVFLLAACVAITLYMEVPRVAFEAERQHELLLIDRGNQFKRAIQVFVTDKTNNPSRRYPASIDELENFNNHRYLRHRYKDPMTGKDEWRLVHINGGVLTDSVTTQQNPNGSQSQASSFINTPAYITNNAFIDSDSAGGARGGGAQRAMQRRASDSQAPGASGDPGMTAGGSAGMDGNAGGMGAPGAPPIGGGGMNSLFGNGQPGQGGQPGTIPGVPGANGVPGNPTAAQNNQQPCTVYIGSCNTPTPGTPGAPGMPGQGIPGQGVPGMPGGMPGGFQGGLPGQPGMPVNSQMGGVSPGYGTTPGSNGMPPGYPQQGAQANTAAANMINGLLTTPRPGGMPTGMPGSSTIGGGIAGVASKFEADGIMVINDRTAINQWEFIFDMTKWRPPPNPVSGAVGTPLQPMQGGNTGTPIGGNGMNGPGSPTPPMGGGRGPGQ